MRDEETQSGKDLRIGNYLNGVLYYSFSQIFMYYFFFGGKYCPRTFWG